jgi:serine-type D-Ala-D-Ala carboxypeptidase (penicillin-binding protein 5/6)
MMGETRLARWALGWALVALVLLPATARAENAPAVPDVTAPAACVVDLATGTILWGRDLHTPRAPASVTKMMTALVAIDLTSLDAKVTIQESDLVGESSMGLESGETLTMEALFYGMLLPSGNDAATAIARTLGAQPGDTDAKQSVQHFVDKMNAKAKALGATETHFVNPHGLDEPGHLTSAADLARIAAAFAANPTLMRIAGTTTYDGFGHTVHTTNKLLYDGRFPAVVGGKTGQTDNAGYTLVEIANRNGRLMLSVELGTTADAFWTDAMHLLAYGYATAGPTTQPRPFAHEIESPAIPTGPVHAELLATSLVAANARATGANPATATTLPVAHRSSHSMIVRFTLLGLLAAVALMYIYARRAAMRRALAEMKEEWHKALADPPHLVATMPIPIVPRDPATAAPSVSSRWAQAGVHLPKGHLEVARAYALQAVRQSSSGGRLAAQQAFKHAVALNPRLEWGAIPGFWEMPPIAYADLATAMIEAGHPSIARSMLTVAALAHPRHPDLRAIEARLTRRTPAPLADATYGHRR